MILSVIQGKTCHKASDRSINLDPSVPLMQEVAGGHVPMQKKILRGWSLQDGRNTTFWLRNIYYTVNVFGWFVANSKGINYVHKVKSGVKLDFRHCLTKKFRSWLECDCRPLNLCLVCFNEVTPTRLNCGLKANIC